MTDFLQHALGSVETAAPALLGCTLLRSGERGLRIVRIVETEAYPQDDPASHSHRGPTARNRSMFGPPGRAYVYRLHRSHCFNIVTGPAGTGEAVLIRAVEPLEGLELLSRARARASVGARAPQGRELTNGPGKLCQALDVDLSLDGIDLLGGRGRAQVLRLVAREAEPPISRSPRVGISQSRDAPLRYFISGNPWVSRPR